MLGDNNIRSICEFFWKIEDKYQLLDRKFSELPVWEYARMPLYYNLLIQLGIGDTPHVTGTNPPGTVITRMGDFFTTWIRRNPFLQLTRCDVLLLEHHRIQSLNEEYVDIYSHFVEQDLTSSNIKWRSLTRSWQKQHLKIDQPQRVRSDALILLARLICKLRFKLTNDEKHIIEQIQDETKNQFNIQWDISKIISQRGKTLRANTLLFTWLLKIWRPKEIYVVVGYDALYAAAILAAHKCQIPVTEIQHGTISRYHLGYSFPGRSKKLHCFPDKLLVWNNMWKKAVPFSPQLAEVEVRRFDWLEARKHQYTNVKKQKAVLVISQGLLGDRIAEEFAKSINLWKGWDIRYKLHPGEYTRWKKYPNLHLLRDKYGITILESCDLYQEMAECKAQVGVFSTAIYEGIEFGCETYLLDLPGIEYMQDLIDAGEAKILRDIDNLLPTVTDSSPGI